MKKFIIIAAAGSMFAYSYSPDSSERDNPKPRCKSTKHYKKSTAVVAPHKTTVYC
ncbi:hypothetical protein [Mucilaginibacter gynuensis]|uniref:hypothetical protein n=1 Tax=Mucilaginibacter gynuensis TaxID=1302236 RepID=UPI0031EA005E